MVRVRKEIASFQKRDTPIVYNNLSLTSEANLQIRDQIKDGLSKRIVKGYGSIWGSKNSHQEKFVKGSFAKSISEIGPEAKANYQIKFRNNHGQSCSLFQILKEDDIGLYFETKPLDAVPWCDHLLVQLQNETINNFSIGFRHVWDKVEWDDEDDCLINLEARLFEISAVDIPSDLETYAVRSVEEIEYLQEDIDNFICSLPFSKQLEARKIITRCMSLTNEEPLEPRHIALNTKEPTETEDGLYDFLIKNFK